MNIDGAVRVAIVEDDPAQLALASKTLSAAGMQVVGAWETGRAALAGLADGGIDVVVIDLQLPDLPGTELMRRIGRRKQAPAFVVLTVHDERATALKALQAGASGYLLKGDLEDLPKAVRVAASGGSHIAPAIARYLLEEIRGLKEAPRSNDQAEVRNDLTKRETEVLSLLAKGLTYEDAARVLGISVGTVQSHVKSLYRKLEVSSKAEAAAEAVRRGLD